MHKKIILSLTLIIFSLSFNLAHAQVRLNEFVSDPDSGSEWIELWNDSAAAVDLSGWNWTDLASPGGETEHESSPRGLSGTISASGVFVLEMNSVLNNTGDSIGLYNGASLVDRVTFGKVNGYSKDLDLPDKGKSGALISGSWQTNQEPTKGATNSSSSSNDNDTNDTDDDSASSSANTSTPNITTQVSSKKKTEVSVRDIAYVGIPHAFQGRVVQGEKQPYHGRYFWNFGDGDFREVKVINTDKFTHTYFYPGEYTVLFEYYPDSFAETPEATSKIGIKVVEPEITISRVGDGDDFFVELWNHTNYDVDLSGWMLWGNGRNFTIPKNTVIVANKKIIISGRTSGLSLADLPHLKLATPVNDVAFEYFASIKSIAKQPPKSPLSGGRPETGSSPDKGKLGGVEDLEAAVLASDTEDNFSPILPVAALVFIGGSAYAVYTIRRTRTIPGAGDDFEILDE